MTLGVKCVTWGYDDGMTEPREGETLRERTRRAVQSELLDAGQELFAERGYEAVTVDQIAEAVGISRRSFFRYFGSKEALVLGKYDRQGEDFAAMLAARPADEPAWVALRRMFDGAVAYISDPVLSRRAAELDRVIQASETLRAGFLERMDRAQRLIVAELGQRRARVRDGQNPDDDDTQNALGDAAVVAAAFASFSAARRAAQSENLSLGEALDVAMTAVASVSAERT